MLVDSKDYYKILPCSLKRCNLYEQWSKANSLPSYFLKVQGERNCNFEKACSRASGSKTFYGRKSNFFPCLGLHPMFVTNRTAVGFTLKTTTSLFEKLYIHVFSFLNNSIQYGVSEITVSSWFFFPLQRKILHLCWKPVLSDRILIVDSILFMSL